MSGAESNPRKRKAEPRERHDGGDKRAKVSSFLRTTVKTPPVLAFLASQFHFRHAAAVRFIRLIRDIRVKETGICPAGTAVSLVLSNPVMRAYGQHAL